MCAAGGFLGFGPLLAAYYKKQKNPYSICEYSVIKHVYSCALAALG